MGHHAHNLSFYNSSLVVSPVVELGPELRRLRGATSSRLHRLREQFATNHWAKRSTNSLCASFPGTRCDGRKLRINRPSASNVCFGSKADIRLSDRAAAWVQFQIEVRQDDTPSHFLSMVTTDAVPEPPAGTDFSKVETLAWLDERCPLRQNRDSRLAGLRWHARYSAPNEYDVRSGRSDGDRRFT